MAPWRMSTDVQDHSLSRRALLTYGAAGLALPLAGCAGDDAAGTDATTASPTGGTPAEPTDSSGSPPDSPTDSSGSPTDSPTTTAEPSLAEPVAVTGDDRCAVCNMKPAMYPAWNAQFGLDVDGGQRAHACSPGCAVAFYASPGRFVDGASQAAIVGGWVHDVATGTLVAAAEAAWVLERDADRIEAPMMRNPLPFAAEDDARAYVARYDDLTRHDVVDLATFDVALAAHFRAKFLPEVDEPSVLEPAAVPEDESCTVCEMTPAKFPDANAQASVEGADRAFCCSPGCLTAFYADPARFRDGVTQDDIVGAWAHDYGTKAEIDAIAASFVLETGGERVDLPMMTNPVPFRDRAAALAYTGQYDDLGEADVVPLTAFTVDLASRYRGTFF